jgi:hypothetical protein
MRDTTTVPVDVDVTLTWPSDPSHEGRRAEFRVLDRASGTLIVKFRVGAEDFASILGQALTVVSGAEVAPIASRDRIGRTRVAGPLDVPEHLRWGSREPTQEMLDYATTAVAGSPWEGATWYRTKNGWTLTGYLFKAANRPS